MPDCKGEKLIPTNQACLSLEQPGLIFGKVLTNFIVFHVAQAFSFYENRKICFFAAIKINTKWERLSSTVMQNLRHFSEKK